MVYWRVQGELIMAVEDEERQSNLRTAAESLRVMTERLRRIQAEVQRLNFYRPQLSWKRTYPAPLDEV